VDPKVEETEEAFLYVDDDPVIGTDPSGMDLWSGEGSGSGHAKAKIQGHGGTIVALIAGAIADFTSAGLRDVGKAYKHVSRGAHLAEDDAESAENIGRDLVDAARGISGAAAVVTTVNDLGQGKSVGYSVGQGLGSLLGAEAGGTLGAAACVEVGPVAVACAAVGAAAGGVAGGVAGGYVGAFLQHHLK
jgi:hypothetical protein